MISYGKKIKYNILKVSKPNDLNSTIDDEIVNDENLELYEKKLKITHHLDNQDLLRKNTVALNLSWKKK